jgi:hypothetical protein
MNWARIVAFPRKYLWQAPRGLVLKLTRDSADVFGRAIAGKSVAIVGNAKSLLDTDFGPLIDAHDVVIRLNKGFVVAPSAQGARTDMIGVTPELTEDEIVRRFDPALILFLIPKLRHLRIYRTENVRKLVFYPLRHWLSDRNMIGRRPSSGFMAVSYVLRLESAASVTLYGFDFGATETYYNPPDYRTPHDYAAEQRIILDWEKSSRITVMRSR